MFHWTHTRAVAVLNLFITSLVVAFCLIVLFCPHLPLFSPFLPVFWPDLADFCRPKSRLRELPWLRTATVPATGVQLLFERCNVLEENRINVCCILKLIIAPIKPGVLVIMGLWIRVLQFTSNYIDIHNQTSHQWRFCRQTLRRDHVLILSIKRERAIVNIDVKNGELYCECSILLPVWSNIIRG